MQYTDNDKAFTLIELSIVLVVIGLIVGGVLVGRDLIRAAELQNIATEYHRYVTAITTFRDKYSALPGDMPNATYFWGAADGAGNGVSGACFATSSSKTTCNGNNDGLIQWTGYSNETYRAWQHLSNAGLVTGNYTGIALDGNYYPLQPGVNAPRSKAGNSAAWYLGTGYWADPTNFFFPNEVITHRLLFGNATSLISYNYEPVLKAGEAYNIDKKIDDGLPAQGKIHTYNAIFSPNCVSDSTITATYRITNTAVGCAFIMSAD